ncbi:helix-turn-helix domain-containing protein [Sphingobacterium thermophilum]|uniref:Helix-turn-helix domain-containing protein n=1 Tax=Sphingobacterium thermophilum TaxID=768534 RepID=A0ABP8QZL2_9SPHI
MKTIEDRLRKIEKLLLAKKETLTLEDTCNYTGISESFMYKLTSARKIPHYKPHGKLIYFKTQELNDWLLQNPVVTIDELRREATSRIVTF